MMRYPYYNGGSHWGLWILTSLAMLVFWGILAWAVVNIVRHNNAHRDGRSQSPAGTGGSDALRILDERFARGEIETDEYTRRRDLLKGGGLPTGPG